MYCQAACERVVKPADHVVYAWMLQHDEPARPRQATETSDKTAFTRSWLPVQPHALAHGAVSRGRDMRVRVTKNDERVVDSWS